jgi:hypothetical protein
MSKSEIATTAAYILFGALLINGCVHSCKKHKDDPIWLQDTPAVICRGVEFFWHDDFAGVDWNERIKDDIMIECRLIDYSTGITNINDIQMQTEEFSKRISTYPSKWKQELKNGASAYIRWNLSLKNDVINYATDIINGLNKQFDFSESTNKIYDSTKNYYGVQTVSITSKSLDSTLNAGNYGSLNNPNRTEEWKQYRNNLSEKWEEAEISMFHSYEKIFKEKFLP